MIQELLAYQTTDAKLRKIETELSGSEERKKALSAKKYLEGVEEAVSKLEARAAELLLAYENATNQQLKLKEQEEELSRAIDTLEDETEVNYLLKKADELLAKIKSFGAEATKIASEIQAVLSEYNNVKLKTKAARTQYEDSGKKYNELKESKKSEKEAIEKELASLKEKVDPSLMERYLKKRAEKIFPVVAEVTDKTCGGCNMELSMSELSKLKSGEIIECDQCRRLIFKA